MRSEALERLTFKHFAIIGVCDADKQPGTLLQAASVKIHGTVFSHNPVGVRTRRYNSATRVDCRDYLVLAFVSS